MTRQKTITELKDRNMICFAGNVFVIAAILLERNLQNVANYLIVSLAVADLMVACLVMPLGAVYVVSEEKAFDFDPNSGVRVWQRCASGLSRNPLTRAVDIQDQRAMMDCPK